MTKNIASLPTARCGVSVGNNFKRPSTLTTLTGLSTLTSLTNFWGFLELPQNQV